MKENTNKELVFQRFVQREYGLSHPTYDSELEFYQLVKSGDILTIKKMNNSSENYVINAPERGILSDDPVRNMKYHLIVSIAMISRFCIEGGLDERMSYGLSDIYIKRIDNTDDLEILTQIHEEFILDYASRMKKINFSKRLSIHCIKAMDYISDNLHKYITVEEVADHLELDRTYFSKHFKKETGQSVSDYIRCKKIQTAKNMLLYSEFKCSEIALYLGFSSQSHFTDCFRKFIGCTPTEYRICHYRRHWTD